MAILHLNKNDFDETVSQGVTLVDFWATWCGPCRMQAPILEQLDRELGEQIRIGKVDVDEQPELAQKFMIYSIPTLMVFKDGKPLSVKVGVQSLGDLKQMVNC